MVATIKMPFHIKKVNELTENTIYAASEIRWTDKFENRIVLNTEEEANTIKAKLKDVTAIIVSE